ncbi:MAG: DUF2946 family protein [Betaproteobacteria bacterium]
MPAIPRLSRLRRRACAWLALVLMALATVAPLVTGALAPAPVHGMEVCTSSGPRTVMANANGERAGEGLALATPSGAKSGAPADGPPPGAGPGMHCPWCLLSHGGLAPPPVAPPFALALLKAPALPWAPQAAPVCGAHQRAAAPRGPPTAA